jgi:hypothetical protein
MSTGFENERQHIEEEFNSNWTSTACPIQVDNVNGLVSGTDIIKDVKGLDKWCRLTILNAISNNVGLGGTMVRHMGDIVINIFTKTGTGTDVARELADDVYDIFVNKSFDTIRCEAPYMNIEGEIDEWYQLTVTVPFIRDEAG